MSTTAMISFADAPVGVWDWVEPDHNHDDELPREGYLVVNLDDGILVHDTRSSADTAIDVEFAYGRWIAFALPMYADALAGAALIAEPQTQRLLDTLWQGYEVVWDGHNHVGSLTAAAEAARQELEELFADVPTIATDCGLMSARDYLADMRLADVGLTVASTAGEIAAAAQTIDADALADGCYLTGDIAAVLTQMQERER